MGGPGSGRKPDETQRIISSMQQRQQAIGSRNGEGMFLPNYSGLKTGLKKTESEVYAKQSEVARFVLHGGTAGTTRPSGFATVVWLGSVEPTNATNGDVWLKTA